MPSKPIDAYQEIEKEALSGRELEAAVLSKAAARLRAVRDQWDSPDRGEMLEEALRYNQRIWTVLQVELTNPDNPLPREVKENLLTLSVFIDKRTFETMAYPSADKLDVLINIDHNIAAGLRGQ
jgi:flagellar protein FlaF